MTPPPEPQLHPNPDPVQLRPASFFLRWLGYLVLAPLFGLVTAFFGTLSLVVASFDSTGRMQHSIARLWGNVALKASLSSVTVINPHNLKACPVAVYAANHLSYMDTPLLFSTLPFQFRILARHDLWKLPFIGWHLRRSGQIPVDSTSLRSSIASLNRGVRALEAGMPVVVFPEGSRTSTGHTGSFMSGPAYMAIRAKVPVVPIALVGTYELLPMHTYYYRPRPLYVVVGTPIPSTGYTTKTIDEYTARIRDAITTLYYEYSESSIPISETGYSESPASDEDINRMPTA